MHNGSAFFQEPMVSRRCLLCVLFACMGIALRGAMQLLIVLPFEGIRVVHSTSAFVFCLTDGSGGFSCQFFALIPIADSCCRSTAGYMFGCSILSLAFSSFRCRRSTPRPSLQRSRRCQQPAKSIRRQVSLGPTLNPNVHTRIIALPQPYILEAVWWSAPKALSLWAPSRGRNN